jgi:hypothetical protein
VANAQTDKGDVLLVMLVHVILTLAPVIPIAAQTLDVPAYAFINVCIACCGNPFAVAATFFKNFVKTFLNAHIIAYKAVAAVCLCLYCCLGAIPCAYGKYWGYGTCAAGKGMDKRQACWFF